MHLRGDRDPTGSRNKYEIDHRDNRVYLDRRLFTATMYPADYGFVPETLGGDGDPLDALVLLDDPVYPGVWVEARPVGVLYMKDEAGEDAKLICVPPGEPRWADVHDISHLTPQLMAEIQHFFEVYKALEPNKYSLDVGHRQPRGRLARDRRGPRQLRAGARPAAHRLLGRRPEVVREQGGADGAGVLAELGERQHRVRAQLGGVQQLAEPAPDRRQVQVGADGEPAAEHERRRVEGVRQVDEAEGDPAGELVDDGQRARVALLGRRLDVLAAHQLDVAAGDVHDPPQAPADGRRPRQLGEAGTRRVALPAPLAAAHARRAVGVDHHVAELAGEAVVPDVQPAVGDDAAADAGPERDHHQVVDAARRALLPLGQRRARGVVAHRHRTADARPEPAGDVELGRRRGRSATTAARRRA